MLPIVLTEDVAAAGTDGFREGDALSIRLLRIRPDLRAARQNIDIADLRSIRYERA